MHRNATLAACLLVALLTGCQSPADRARIGGALIDSGDALRLGYHLGPATSLGMVNGQHVAHAVVLGDLLVVTSRPDNIVSAVSIRDGGIRWQSVVGSSSEPLYQPLRWEDAVLVNTPSNLYWLDAATGQLRALRALEAPVEVSPVRAEDLAIFGGVNGRLFAVNLRTSMQSWFKLMEGAIIASPVANGSNLFVTDTTGIARMYVTWSGEFRWATRTFGRISAAPAITANTVYLASEDQSLYALNAEDGQDLWPPYRADRPLRHSPTVLGNLVFLPLERVGMDVIDAATGQRLWRFGVAAQPVALVRDYLLLNHGEELALVDPSTGQPFVQAPVAPLHTVLTLPDGRLLLVSRLGRIQQLNPAR